MRRIEHRTVEHAVEAARYLFVDLDEKKPLFRVTYARFEDGFWWSVRWRSQTRAIP